MTLEEPSKTEAKQLSDNELVERIVKRGEKQWRGIIYDRYADKVYRRCLSLTKQANLSQDLMHDIMVKILTNLAKFKGSSDFSFWVYSISYNHCMDYLRKRKKLRTQELSVTSEMNDIAEDNQEREAKLLKELRLTQLERLFEQLKPKERAILMMRYQDGMSIKQIAVTLEIKESAAKMRLQRSRNQLAELIKLEDHEA